MGVQSRLGLLLSYGKYADALLKYEKTQVDFFSRGRINCSLCITTEHIKSFCLITEGEDIEEVVARPGDQGLGFVVGPSNVPGPSMAASGVRSSSATIFDARFANRPVEKQESHSVPLTAKSLSPGMEVEAQK